MPVNTNANPFVANLGAAQNLTVLQGFFGDGTANKKRIYFSMDLEHYAEFATASVKHRTTTSPEDHPLGLEIDTVWLEEGVAITYVPHPYQPPGGHGGFFATYGGGPGPYGGGQWAGAHGPYGGGQWAGAYGPYGGGLWAGAIGPYGGGQWSG